MDWLLAHVGYGIALVVAMVFGYRFGRAGYHSDKDVQAYLHEVFTQPEFYVLQSHDHKGRRSAEFLGEHENTARSTAAARVRSDDVMDAHLSGWRRTFGEGLKP